MVIIIYYTRMAAHCKYRDDWESHNRNWHCASYMNTTIILGQKEPKRLIKTYSKLSWRVFPIFFRLRYEEIAFKEDIYHLRLFKS
jgi:hypothetical protein